jgi:hypothetical protein
MRRADQKTIVFPKDYSCKVCGALLFSVKKFSRENHSNRLFQERWKKKHKKNQTNKIYGSYLSK